MTPPPPWRLQSFAALASTQDLCCQLAEADEPAYLAVLAGRQTQGRGTHGRDWASPDGNLFLSVLLRPRSPARDAGQWGLLAGVALAEAVEASLPDPRAIRLRWPNDLLLAGRKLAGILTESAARPDGTLDWLVIGFGVNLASAPALPDRPTACLAERVAAPAPEVFASDLLRRLDHWRGRLLADGFAPVRAAWLARAPDPGAAVVLRRGGQDLSGTFAGLSEDGRLLLSAGGATRIVTSGET